MTKPLQLSGMEGTDFLNLCLSKEGELIGQIIRPVRTVTRQELRAALRAVLIGDEEPPPTPPSVPAFPLRHFSQRDPVWAGDLLGEGPLTIGEAGCALVSCAMLASQVDADITPAMLNDMLNGHAGFVYVSGAPNIRWATVAECVPKLKYIGRRDWDGPLTSNDLANLRRQIEGHGPQIIEVDLKPEIRKQYQHFVVAMGWITGERGAEDDLTIIDPIDGETATLLARYGSTRLHSLRLAIWGWRGYYVK